MTAEQFKTMVLVQIEMWRGCCQTPTISKKKIAESMRKFSDELEKVKVHP